ncbi:ER lumen protein-retaining receptor A [Tanacetum coccineum]
MKIVFIVTSLAIVYCMRWHRVVKRSYDREIDTFKYEFLVLASFLLALLLNDKFTFFEIFWAFSIYLEAVAILPQLVLLQRSGNVDNLTGQYVFFLGHVVRVGMFGMMEWKAEKGNESLSLVWLILGMEMKNQILIPFPLKSFSKKGGEYKESTRHTVDCTYLTGFTGISQSPISMDGYVSSKKSPRAIDAGSPISSCISGLLQTALYADFFYYYFISWKNNSKLQLPA